MKRICICSFVLFLFACTPRTTQLYVSDESHALQLSNYISFSSIDREEAIKGLIAEAHNLVINGRDGTVICKIMSDDVYKIHNAKYIHPLLRELATIDSKAGLYEVCNGIYQIRGFDLANITFVKGNTGWIVIDALTCAETAHAAYNFFKTHKNATEPIKAIIFTHSHIDHFGGVLGIIEEKDVENKNIKIIAPKGFMEEAFSENILLAPAMSRRSEYQFGLGLQEDSVGYIHTGIGKMIAKGTHSLVKPTDLVSATPTIIELDGVKFVFQYTPETEAPAEMTVYIPRYKAFCPAEIVNRTMHNLCPMRGSKVRDAYKWSFYINEAKQLFGDAEICFFTHLWPMYGRKRIHELMEKQADAYKFIHDQTIRLANRGYKPNEIANALVFPPSLSGYLPNRDLYGTVSQNVRSVYQKYLGWYDGNPAHLNPLPDGERAKKYIDYMGGAKSVLEKAKTSYAEGDYRWVAEVLNLLIFAYPENKEAMEMLANTYCMLASFAESGAWRNAYLLAAQELRCGEKKADSITQKAFFLLKNMSPQMVFDSLAVNIDPQKAKNISIKISFIDIKETYSLYVRNSVLHHTNMLLPDHHATLQIPYQKFIKILIGEERKVSILFDKDVRIEGSKMALVDFFKMFERPQRFPIVTPRK